MIVLNRKNEIVGEYCAPVPLESHIFRAAAYPPLRMIKTSTSDAAPADEVSHAVTFEKGRYKRTDGGGRTFWALKVIDGEEHIGHVRAFYSR